MGIEKCVLETIGYTVAGAAVGGVLGMFPAMMEVIAAHPSKMIFENYQMITGYAALAAAVISIGNCLLPGDKNYHS